jgi:excisionase family DNA binding protein
MSEVSLPRLVKKRDVAAALSCSVKHVDHLIKSGKLSTVSLGTKTVRVTLESVKAFISEQ